MSTISVKNIENEHDVYIGIDCTKNICESLRKTQ